MGEGTILLQFNLFLLISKVISFLSRNQTLASLEAVPKKEKHRSKNVYFSYNIVHVSLRQLI